MLRPGPQSGSSMSSEVTSRQRNRVQGLHLRPGQQITLFERDGIITAIPDLLLEKFCGILKGMSRWDGPRSNQAAPPLRISNRDETKGEAGELPCSKGERRQRR